MKILILGATGRTGKQLLKEALAMGISVHILVRDPQKIDPVLAGQAQIFTGNPTDPAILEQALYGCQAVVSALNISRNSDFPWSKLRTPPDLLSKTMANLIPLCKKLSINRLITVSAWGAGDSRPQIPIWFKWLIAYSNMRYPYADHERQEELIRRSGLDYTIVRPVVLTNFTSKKNAIVSVNNRPKPRLTISRLNVARFILAILKEGYCGQTVVVST